MNMLKDYASIAHAAVHSDAAFGSTAFLSLVNYTLHSFKREKTSTALINIWMELENFEFNLFIYFLWFSINY